MHARFAVIAVAAACSGSPKPAPTGTAPDPDERPAPPDERPAPPPEPAFEPTAFGVQVTGRGRPIIFIPGLASPGAVWDGTVARLADRHECHVLTLSGFAGRPPIDEPLSAATRRELARYIRARRLDRPIIVGHSMGGFIALWLAVEHPERVGPVIVVDAGPGLEGDLDEAKQLRDRWATATDAQFAARAKVLYGGMVRDPKRLTAISALAAKSDRRTIGEAIYEMMTTDLTPRMAEVRSPALFVLADGALQHRTRKQVAAIPDKELVVVPRARHFVMIDDPDRFLAAVEAFLAAHPANR